MLISSNIYLQFPLEWHHFSKKSRHVFQSPNREEVIVSAYQIEGVGSNLQRGVVLDQLFQNAAEAAKKAAAHPELRITKEFAEDSGCAFPCWTIIARTFAEDIFFGQAVLRHTEGSLLLTYEAPNLKDTERDFRNLLKLILPVKT